MLLLIHHGRALDPIVDPSRPLSTRGLAEVARLADLAALRGIKPDVIWHSGKLRARQTAEAFWRRCNPLSSMGAIRGLLPDDPPEWLQARLVADARTILLVGHMPHLSRLLRLLTTGAASGETPFPPHGCVALEEREPRWEEIWRETT